MDVADLEIFVELVEARALTDAARRLGISKSMVSRGLSRLEASLGTQLMTRTPRGVTLTEAGSSLLEHARRICLETEMAREAVHPSGELRGLLRITAPLSFGPSFIAPAMAEMARRYPELHIFVSYSDRYVNIVKEGFDCAIRIGRLPDSDLVARRIGPIYGKLVASPDYLARNGCPQRLEDLSRHEALLQPDEVWRFMKGSEIITIHPHGRFKSDHGASLASAAAEGLGIALLPDFLVQTYLESGALVEVLQNFLRPEAGIFVVRPPGQNPARKIRLLTDFLIEFFDRSKESWSLPPEAPGPTEFRKADRSVPTRAPQRPRQ